MGAQLSKATNDPAGSASHPARTDEPTPLDEKRALAQAPLVPAVRHGRTRHQADKMHAIKAKDGFEGIPISTFGAWDERIDRDPVLQLSKLVLCNADPLATITSRKSVIRDALTFNTSLKGVDAKGEYPGPRVSQNASGRCWLFATTNVLRYNVIELNNLGDFELSQAYLFFYDKLEKANYYLENVLELVDEPLDGRLMSFLNVSPIGDGGQWDMAVNLLEKYGVLPKALYPESFSSSSSGKLNTLLTSKLREFALTLRAASLSEEHTSSSLRQLKAGMIAQVYSTLCITMGTPPKPDEKLKWEHADKNDKYIDWEGTPREFYAQFGRRKGMDPSSGFSLINDPRNGYEKLYTVERLGNVWGARNVNYVNAPIEALEDAVIAGIKANTPMFFGCDVGKSSNRDGIMDLDLYDLKAAYGFAVDTTKAQRLELGDSSMTHAMVITAVHLDSHGRPVRYKVENSWSDQAGVKGWFMMTAPWFREFVYQVVVPRSLADKKYTAVLDGGKAVVLKPWDPMGALA